MAVNLDMDALLSAAGQVSGIAGNFSSDLSSLGTVVNATKSYWNDPAQVAFEEKYNAFKTTMDQFITALNNYSTAMKTHAENTSAALAQGKSMFDSI